MADMLGSLGLKDAASKEQQKQIASDQKADQKKALGVWGQLGSAKPPPQKKKKPKTNEAKRSY